MNPIPKSDLKKPSQVLSTMCSCIHKVSDVQSSNGSYCKESHVHSSTLVNLLLLLLFIDKHGSQRKVN